MNIFASQLAVLELAASHYHEVASRRREAVLHGMFWLCEQLLAQARERCDPRELDYPQTELLVVQAHIEAAFQSPDRTLLTSEILDSCVKISARVPDSPDTD